MGISTSKGAPKSNHDTLEVIGQLQNMSIADKDVSVCANCGKEGDNVNNICNKCKQVKYCNAACKKKHRHKHKKDCEEHIRLADERAAELHDIELFKQPPPAEDDCPICFVRLPSLETGSTYQTCCGKVICCGCDYAPVYDNQGNKVDNDKQNECPFCRIVAPKSENEMVKRTMKRAEINDPRAIHNLGNYYRNRSYGLTQDYRKALELWHRSADLGFTEAYVSIGYAYNDGEGVKRDKKKAKHYYELAALKGNEVARANLGCVERDAGNIDRALKHYMIAVRSGNNDSLEAIQELYSKGYATKEDYAKALRSYQEYLSEIKSSQRDRAAAFSEANRYY